MTGKVGIIGVGNLAGYLVEGLRRGGEHIDIVLSPRRREMAAKLAERYGATVAPGNREVVEESSMIIVATRPDQVPDAVLGLPWRADQVLVSVAAGVSRAEIQPAVVPALVVRAMPVSCAAIGESPTSVFPEHPEVMSLLARLGPVIALPDESRFEAAGVMGAFYAWTYALAQEVSAWTESEGIPSDTARLLVVQTMLGASRMMLDRAEQPIGDILASLVTRGGITERGLEILRQNNALAAWSQACDAVLEKLRRGGKWREV